MQGMKLAGGVESGSSGDVSQDRAAWGGITASTPFAPLPDEFGGQYVKLRFHFHYNPDKAEVINEGPLVGCQRSKGGIKVSISLPSGSPEVPVGGSDMILATVKGTTNTALKWSVSGPGCSGSACGTIVEGLYAAPSAVPSPSIVTVTATSEADPTASASIPIEVVQAHPSH